MATPTYSGMSSDPWDNAGFILHVFVIELTRGQQIRAIYQIDTDQIKGGDGALERGRKSVYCGPRDALIPYFRSVIKSSFGRILI